MNVRAPGCYAGLTVKQAQLLSFLRYQEAEGKTPSYEEMMEALDLASKSGVHRLVSALRERGYVSKAYHRARSIRTIDNAVNLADVSIGRLVSELERRGLRITAA